jgi:plastocyanin
MTRVAPWLSVFVLLAGCEVGTITGPGAPDDDDPAAGADAGDDVSPDPGSPDAAPPESFSLTVSPDRGELRLNESVDVVVAVSSERFAGDVELVASGAPASWDVSFDPSPVVTVAADGVATTTLRVSVPPDARPEIAVLRIDATSTIGPGEAYFPVTVANEIVLAIPPGTGSGNHPFPPQIPLRPGTQVIFSNLDTVVHRIHSSVDGDGFPHQPDPGILPGETFSVQPSATRAYDYYCHEHDAAAGTGLLLVSDGE